MEPTPQEDAEGQAIVDVLSAVLERLVSANNNAHLSSSEQRRQQEETKFTASKAPAISVRQYLERIQKYACCSKECFILALIYIDRFIRRNSFLLTDLNVHRVVITSVLVAAKFFDDAYYNNAYYAKVGGVLVAEMNALEAEFLFMIDFSLRASPEEFENYRIHLAARSTSAGPDGTATRADDELPGAGGGTVGRDGSVQRRRQCLQQQRQYLQQCPQQQQQYLQQQLQPQQYPQEPQQQVQAGPMLHAGMDGQDYYAQPFQAPLAGCGANFFDPFVVYENHVPLAAPRKAPPEDCGGAPNRYPMEAFQKSVRA